MPQPSPVHKPQLQTFPSVPELEGARAYDVTKDEALVLGVTWEERKTWFFRLPIFQFAALFWYSTPKFEEVIQGLSTLGVIAALLLTLVIVLPTTLGISDYVAANKRFTNTATDNNGMPLDYSKYATYWNTSCTGMSGNGAYPVSDIFLRLSMLTVATLLTSVLLACVIYFHITFGKATGTRNAVSLERREFEWWRSSKYVMASMVGCLGALARSGLF